MKTKIGSKILLRENISLNSYETLDKSKTLTEDSKSNSYKSLAILRNVKVSKYTENVNDRIYPKELWEKIYDEKTYEGTLSLADHPKDDDDGSVKDIVAVWHNLKVGNEYVTCDCYLLDNPNGNTILKTIEAGGEVGVSSVGYGEIDTDGKTVIPETYELVRVGDFVINPSQKVYANISNLSNKKSENVQKINENIINENTNYMRREIINKDINMSLENLQIANLKNQIREQIKKGKKAMESKDMASLLESYNDLREMDELIPNELEDQKEIVDETLEEMGKVLGESIKEKDNKLKESNTEISKAKHNYNLALKTLRSLKSKLEETNKVKSILEHNTKSYDSDLQNSLKDISLMEKDISKFKYQRKSMKENIKLLIKERRNLLEDNVNLLKLIAKLKESKHKERLRMSKPNPLIVKLKMENSRLKKRLKSIRENDIDMVHSNTDEYSDTSIGRIENKYTPNDIGLSIDPSMDFQADDPAMGLIPDPPSEILVKENGKLKKRFVKEELKKYYIEQVKRYPNLRFIQNEILRSNSLIEAVNKVESYKVAGVKVLNKTKINESSSSVGFTDFSKRKNGII